MFKRILFATDFSAHAEVAKQVAICLAQGGDKQLWALTVLEPVEEPLAMASEPAEVSPRKWERLQAREERRLERDKERRLAKDVAEIEAAGVTVTKLVREGDPDKEIIAATREMKADLIVMGSHSRRNLWDVVLGSTTAKVAKAAPCPVLITSHRPPHRGPATPKRFLFATDFSAHAEMAEKVAFSLARERGEQHHLWVLTVIEPSEELPVASEFVGYVPESTATELERELHAEEEAKVNQQLKPIIAAAQEAGLKPETLIRHGHPAKEIVKAAIDLEADMIIVGSHSRRHIWEMLLGTTTEGVAKLATCPVLVVSDVPENELK